MNRNGAEEVRQVGAEHEQAKGVAAAEVAEHGDALPLTRRPQLRDRIWTTADTDD